MNKIKAFFNKIKAFFNNKSVRIVTWIIFAIIAFILILVGVSARGTTKVPTFIVGIVIAVALFIVFIKKRLQAKDTNKK